MHSRVDAAAAAAADSASARAQRVTAAAPSVALGAWGVPLASPAAFFAGSAAAAAVMTAAVMVNPAAAAARTASKSAVVAAPAAAPRATVASAGGAWGRKAPAAAAVASVPAAVPVASSAAADSRAHSTGAATLPAICVSLVLQWLSLRDLVRAQRCSKTWLSAAASPLVTRPPAAAAVDFAQRLLDAADDAEPIAALFVPAGLSVSFSSAAAALQLRSTHPLCAALIGASLEARFSPPTVHENDYGVAREERNFQELAAGLAVLTALPRLTHLHFHFLLPNGLSRLRHEPLQLFADASVQTLRTLSLKQNFFLLADLLRLIHPLQKLEAIELCHQQLQYAGDIPLDFAESLSKLPRLAYIFFSVGSSFVSRRSDMEELRALVQCCPSLQLIRWAHPCPQTLFSSIAKLAPVRLIRRVHVPVIRESIATLQACLDLFPDLQEISLGSVPWPEPKRPVPFPASLCEVLRAFTFRAEDATSLLLVLRSLCASHTLAQLMTLHLTRFGVGGVDDFEPLYALLLSRLPMLTDVSLENLPLTDAATLASVAPQLRTLAFVPAAMLASRDSIAQFLEPLTALRTLRVRMASDPLASAEAARVLRARPYFQRIVVGVASSSTGLAASDFVRHY